MRNYAEIIEARGLEVLDSRGRPTVSAEVTVEYRGEIFSGTAAVPSGASTGAAEAAERRDGNAARYRGRGVQGAVRAVSGEISDLIGGMDAFDQRALDFALIECDGTASKSRLGANAMLAVSLAAARAAANALRTPLYRYLGGANAYTLPLPMANVLNGGAHAANNIDIQEFMVVPVGAPTFADAVRMIAEIYYALGDALAKRGLLGGVGDEGGFAPSLDSDEDALKLLGEACRDAGYTPGGDVFFALDPATSEWYDEESGIYRMPSRGDEMTADGLVRYWEKLCAEHPIISLEDGCAEEDWAGWQALTRALSGRVQLVGDDLFVTNARRLERGIRDGAAGAILLKPNQAGTLTETVAAARAALTHGLGAVMSHRSGETEDTFIADLAVALGCGQIKTGAPARSDRTAKYNRLLYIESELCGSEEWLGGAIYSRFGRF